MKNRMSWWRTDAGVKSLKLGVIGLAVGLLGLAATVWSSSSSGTSRPTTGPIRTLVEVEANLTQGLAIWHGTDVLIADGSVVRSIQPSGDEWEVLNVDLGTTASNFVRDIAVGRDDSVYVSDDAGLVQRYSEGQLEAVLGGSDSPVELNTPRGLAATPDGSLFIADMLNDRVLRYNVDRSVVIVDGAINMPNDMAVDSRGRAHVASSDGRIYRVVDNELVEVFDIRDVRTRSEQQEEAVLFIAFTPDDELIVSDELRSTIWWIRDDGARRVLGVGTSVSSPDGVPADQATIAAPWAVAVMPDLRLLVSESGRIRVVQMTR